MSEPAAINWELEAKRALEQVQNRLSEAHRGAVMWHAPTSTVLAFGIDDRPEPLAKRCKEAGIPVRAVAVNDDSETFVLLVETSDVDQLTEWLWESWWAKQGNPDTSGTADYEQYQRLVAAERLARFMSGFEKYWDQQDQR